MDWKAQLGEIKNTIIEREEVFEAIRRGNHQFEDASNADILDHFDLASAEELQGHVNNTKGILIRTGVSRQVRGRRGRIKYTSRN